MLAGFRQVVMWAEGKSRQTAARLNEVAVFLSLKTCVGCEAAFASKLAPTGSACRHRFVIDPNPCGSGLAREDVSSRNASLRACHRSLLLRQLQIIHHPIHRQLAEHDQLRDTQQRPALRRGYEVGEVMSDGSG